MFEVTGPVSRFASAVARIAGLEFAGEEELVADEHDASPEFYLLVPQLGALTEIVSLWERWIATGSVPRNYTPWRDLFLQLRSVRPWGPADRVSPANIDYFRLASAGSDDDEPIRIEVELIYRGNAEKAQTAEDTVRAMVVNSGGRVIDSCYHDQFAYHALLVELPAIEIRRIAELEPTSLAGAEPVASIVPQSVGTTVDVDDRVASDVAPSGHPRNLVPIAAVFDAVPVQAHPLLAGRLTIDDPENLEALAVGTRVHGTAMASLVVHGDLNDGASPVSRSVYFRPVMYAPAGGDEIFKDDRLVIDVIVEAVLRMRQNGGEEVVVINLSLGDRTKPFSGRISTWARALDYLAFSYGLLFLVSAGNCGDEVEIAGFANAEAFNEGAEDARQHSLLSGLDAVKADRRLLAPADSMNALTIGAWNRDASVDFFPGASPFPAYPSLDMPNFSSRLGPGLKRSTKPDALLPGGREHLRFIPTTAPPRVTCHTHPTRFWGLKVAAPPNDAGDLHYTMGTSAATAVATHAAHRIYDALEEAYPDIIDAMPLMQRAILLKSLLVHSASWRSTDGFIRSVVDPTATLHTEHWRREVCRYLGFGFVDPEDAIACTSDRATLWATGTLAPEESLTFDVPLPDVLASSAAPREVRATLSWFTPIRPGHLAYRAVKLRVTSLEASSLALAGLTTTSDQPTNSQSESGTLVHRRWRASRIGQCEDDVLPIQIQREKDQGTPIDEAVPFGLAVTIEMQGAAAVYEQVRAGIALQPRAIIRP